jgi:hypothetical protein
MRIKRRPIQHRRLMHLDASPKRSITLTAYGPDTPLAKPQIGLKSFDDGHP